MSLKLYVMGFSESHCQEGDNENGRPLEGHYAFTLPQHSVAYVQSELINSASEEAGLTVHISDGAAFLLGADRHSQRYKREG